MQCESKWFQYIVLFWMYSTHFKQTYVCALRFQGGGELLQAHGFPVALWAADLLKTAPYTITGLRFLFVFFLFFLNVARVWDCLLRWTLLWTYRSCKDIQTCARLLETPWWCQSWQWQWWVPSSVANTYDCDMTCCWGRWKKKTPRY